MRCETGAEEAESGPRTGPERGAEHDQGVGAVEDGDGVEAAARRPRLPLQIDATRKVRGRDPVNRLQDDAAGGFQDAFTREDSR